MNQQISGYPSFRRGLSEDHGTIIPTIIGIEDILGIYLTYLDLKWDDLLGYLSNIG